MLKLRRNSQILSRERVLFWRFVDTVLSELAACTLEIHTFTSNLEIPFTLNILFRILDAIGFPYTVGTTLSVAQHGMT